MLLRFQIVFALLMAVYLQSSAAFCAPSDSTEVLTRRGIAPKHAAENAPTITLTEPQGGWTSKQQILVQGECSDPKADPISVNINGTRYFTRSISGKFARRFPAAPGKNSIVVECENEKGTARASALVDAAISPLPLKIVLTSDTDNVYTDLHIYEPDGTHVYWASTQSPSGGIFFLNQEGKSFDQPGYGPYLYVHPSAPIGVFRVDVNYWPGGAVRHTLANLDIILNEGSPDELRKRARAPLAQPDETRTIAYIIVKPNRAPAEVYVPGGSSGPPPEEVLKYQREIEPKLRNQSYDELESAALLDFDEKSVRTVVAALALHQVKAISPRWEEAQRDCAGLVRFVYREALLERDAVQARDLLLPPGFGLPVVSRYARLLLPEYPRLWKAGFTAPHGRHEQGREYSFFADAEALVGFNFNVVSKSVIDALPGDLLVYSNLYSSTDQAEVSWHMMIAGTEYSERMPLVYHNGARGKDAQVRVVSMQDLKESSDPHWIPHQNNPAFLGVLRWKKFKISRRRGTEA